MTPRFVVVVQTEAEGVTDTFGPMTREKADVLARFLTAQLSSDDFVHVCHLGRWTRDDRSRYIADRKARSVAEDEWASRYEPGGIWNR